MAKKIELMHQGQPVGSFTLFDCEPSFELIHAIFPGPVRIYHDLRRDTWSADLLDLAPPLLDA